MADIIVVGNEKGGAGKSTLAIHLMTALLHGGARVGALDLDVRQQSLAHFIDNRAAWLAANGAEAPMPENVRLDAALARAPEAEAQARTLINAYMARYRPRRDVNGLGSFTTMQTALNSLASHYTTYSNRPLPDTLRNRVRKELEQAAASASKGA